MNDSNTINYSRMKQRISAENDRLNNLPQEDLELKHRDNPNYVFEEEDDREWYLPKEMKNKTAFKFLLAGVAIIAVLAIIQGIFHA